MPTNPTIADDGGNDEDLGAAVVLAARQALQVDDEWSRPIARGFEWWPHDRPQRIWTDPPVRDGGTDVWRIHAESDFLDCATLSRARREHIETLLSASMMSAVFRDRTRNQLVLHSTVLIHERNLSWARVAFVIAAALQSSVAEKHAEGMGRLVGMPPARSEHPTAGTRTRRHDMLDIDEALAEDGQDASRFVAADIDDVDAAIAAGAMHSVAGGTGLTAELTFGPDSQPAARGGPSVLLVVETSEPHPSLGYGAIVRLHLPGPVEVGGRPIPALSLNRLESRAWTGAHLLGSWCHVDGPAFVGFVPNALNRPGVLAELVLSSVMRARWVESLVHREGTATATDDDSAAEEDVVTEEDAVAPSGVAGQEDAAGRDDAVTQEDAASRDER